jgi:hypothetical protein
MRGFLEPKLFVPPGHFYSPIPDVIEATERLRTIQGSSPPAVGGICIDPVAMQRLWGILLAGMADCDFPETRQEHRRYYFENDFYSYGDALVFRSMVKHLRPIRLVEVGSGFSSAVALDTREACGFPREMTFIEPYQERLQQLLRGEDAREVRILERKVQQVDRTLFTSLQANDIMFIDSSHVVKTGSDLHHILFEIVPALSAGVVLHFHDVFWPFEYPESWAVEQLRAWNEVYFLRAFLMYNHDFEIMFFNDYFAKMHTAYVVEASQFLRNPGGGLWLRKCR